MDTGVEYPLQARLDLLVLLHVATPRTHLRTELLKIENKT